MVNTRLKEYGLRITLGAISLLACLGIVVFVHLCTVYNSTYGDDFHDHMQYTSGVIVRVDTKEKMFIMTVEAGNRQEIGKSYLLVDYSESYSQWAKADNLTEGDKVTVGYLLPLTNFSATLSYLQIE